MNNESTDYGEICYGWFDREELERVRTSMPVVEHRRRDVYQPSPKL